MIKETITRIKLTASEGMVLTNGETYGTEIFLHAGDDGSAYHEITRAEYDAIMAEQEKAAMPTV